MRGVRSALPSYSHSPCGFALLRWPGRQETADKKRPPLTHGHSSHDSSHSDTWPLISWGPASYGITGKLSGLFDRSEHQRDDATCLIHLHAISSTGPSTCDPNRIKSERSLFVFGLVCAITIEQRTDRESACRLPLNATYCENATLANPAVGETVILLAPPLHPYGNAY